MSEPSNNPPQSNPPAPGPAPSASPPRGGKRAPPSGGTPAATRPAGSSPLKTAIPIVALAAVVFGITLMSQYSQKSGDEGEGDQKSKTSASSEKALYFPDSLRIYQPLQESGQGDSLDPASSRKMTLNNIFPGFYEPGETWNRAAFWLENRNSAPVSMRLVKTDGGTGCSQCVAGRLAPIPEETADQLVWTSVLSGLPMGPVSGLPIAAAGAAAHLAPERLQWQQFDAGIPNAEFKVPARPGTARGCPYQWSIFEILFKVKEVGVPKKPIEADLSMRVDGTEIAQNTKLTVGYVGVDPFDLSAMKIDFGEISETSDPKSIHFLVHSATRGPRKLFQSDRQDLAAPSVQVRIPGSEVEPGPIFTVGEPSRVPESQLGQLQAEASVAHRQPVRVESAYVYTITLNPRGGDRRIDIGLLERDIALTLPGMAQPKVIRVKSMVRGSVWLASNRTEIDLPAYRSQDGLIQTVKIVTENRDTVLRLVSDECQPKFASYQLTRLPPAPDYGYHEVKVEVSKNSQTGTWNGVIILEVVGPKPQRIRIPVHGAARL